MVRECKWVDELIEDAPYSPTTELLDRLNCRYAAHGDDCSINADGEDAFGLLKRLGRVKIFKRTEGVSTTNIVGKLLLMTRDPMTTIAEPIVSSELSSEQRDILTTSRRISQFSNKREPKEGDTIVYIDGTFDLFHIGHVEVLKKAKELGDFLIVGVHDD
jgi:ethanolamine-phosphate cytidylyltransferase